MVARSEVIDRTMEEYDAANCLMLLTKVGQCGGGGGGGGEGRVFRCKTCLKEFTSFQALGGHRASHKKPIKNGEDHTLSSTKKAKLQTSHRCPICGVEFPMGQALGGHMRKHKNEKENDTGALVTRSFLQEETSTSTVTTLKNLSNGKRIACLDLGFDPFENFINLKLEL